MTFSSIWNVIWLVWILSEVAIFAVTRTRRSTGNVQDRGSLALLWAVNIAAITAGTWFGEAHQPTALAQALWLPPVSIALMIAGLTIRFLAILKLGRSFSVNVAINATQTVEKTGLFRFVRHPSYSGLLLIFAAIGLHTRHWLGFLIVVVPTLAALSYRIHVEEGALTGAFGTEYTQYCRHTKRLIPGLY